MSTGWRKKLFGLHDPTLDNLLWNVFWMMRSLTVNVDSQSNFKASTPHYIFAITCFITYIYYYQIGMIYNIGWVYPISQDLTVLSIIISLAFASQISTIKILAVLTMRKRIKILIDKYRAFDAAIEPNSRYANAVLNRLQYVKRRAIIFWCSFCSTSALYLLLPAFLPGHNLPENGLKIYGLEPMSETPNYEIAYTLCAVAGTFATAGISNVTVLLIVLSGYLEAHLLALTNEYDCLWSDTLKHTENYKTIPTTSECQQYRERNQYINKYINKLLINFIKKHITLLECHRMLKDLFNVVIALEFLFTTIAMCAMLLGGLEDTYLQIPYTITQLVVDTIVGQRLIDSSIQYEESIYRCGWENFDKSNMKIIRLLKQCSQRTLTLTAGNITFLSYICFTSIVRLVYSAYATLRQAMNK